MMTQKRMDAETAGRVNAVVLDIMSAFRKTVELYWHTPELIVAAGFDGFEDWVRAQPKPQLTSVERKELAAEYVVELGMTQREVAAALGVARETINRDLAVTEVTPEPNVADQLAPENVTEVTPEPDPEEWDRVVDAAQTPESRRKADVLRFEAATQGAAEALDRITPALSPDEAAPFSITYAAIVRRLNRGRPKTEVVS